MRNMHMLRVRESSDERFLAEKEFRDWENQICGNGSAQSVFLIGGSVFVYKCVHLSSRRVWDAADTGA